MKTVDFLDAVKARHNLPSDYAAAKFLELTQAQVSRYRTGRDYFGDEVALRVAEHLAMPPAYVLACVHAERASTAQLRSIWTKIATNAKKASSKAGTAAACGILSVAFSGGPDAWNPDEHGAKSPSLISRAALTLYTSWKVSAAKIACYMRAIFDELPTPEHA